MERLRHQSRFHNITGRETKSEHEINVDTCIPTTLLKHAKACKRNIHEVPRDDNSLFSALADQLTDATFTGQSLLDHIETFISDRLPSEQHESFLLSNPNSRQDTRPSIQDAADFLRHPIVLYRDDDNPPFFFQPNDGLDPIFQILHIGCINNKYYVSFRPHDYIKGQGASVPRNTDSDEDGSDTESENPRTLLSIGDENKTTIVAPGDAEKPINLTVIERGDNNRVGLNIIVSENFDEYVERMIASDSSVGDKVIRLKINISGLSQSEIERAEYSVIEKRITIQKNINAKIRSHGVELSMLGLGCLLMCFRPKSWLNCRAFIMGLRLQNEKYLDIFRQLLTAFQHINDSNNLTMDVKISIGQISEGTNVSDCISETEFKDIGHARDMDKTPQPFEKKDVGKKQRTTDPRSVCLVGKDDTLSLEVVVRPVGDKSSLSSTDLKRVAMRTAEQMLEFKEADVPYIPHTKTHDQMTTKASGSKRNVASVPPDGLGQNSSKSSSWGSSLGYSSAYSGSSSSSSGCSSAYSVPPDGLDLNSSKSSSSSSSSGYSSAYSVSSYRKHRSRSRFFRSYQSKDADSAPPDGLGQHSVRSNLKPGESRHLHRPRFWKLISVKLTKLLKDQSKDADSAPHDGLGQHSVRSSPSKDTDSVPPDGLGQHSVRSSPSLSNADEELRSLLTKNLSDDVRWEFARLPRLSINDPDTDGALNTMKGHVFVIFSEDKQIGTAFSLGHDSMLTAGHVIGGSKGKDVLAKNELLSVETRLIGISSIADVGVLRPRGPIYPISVILFDLGIDFGIESCTYIYVVGYVDGNMFLQGEKCPVLPPRDKDDGYIRFQSKLFHQGSSGSPCLVFKNGKFVVKGILVGREEGTNMPYELIAITFRCLWKRLGLP